MAVRDPIVADDTAPSWLLSVRTGDRVRQVPLAQGRTTLGRSPTCGVVVYGEGIAREHAVIDVTPRRAMLSILPEADPAMLNGLRVRQAGLLPGDWVQLGDVQLCVQRPEGQEPADTPAADGVVAGETPPPSDWVALLERLCAWGLRGAPAQRGQLLAEICSTSGARAAATLRAERKELVCVSAWGDPLHGIDTAELARAALHGGEGVRLARGRGFVLATAEALQGVTFSLLLRGDDLQPAADPLLRVAVRLFAHDHLRERAAIAPPRPPGGLTFPPEIVVGRSARMRVLYEQLDGIVDSHLPVLILGETGVGKEHIAQLVHESSRRRDAPFVTINCAAIPSELLEAELFGIERGVATGVEERAGKFREAHGGTLFLDEIGELPLPLQAKLLRALEEKQVRPVGGRASAVDVRVIAATNAALDTVAGGTFRLDLFHRLAGFVVSVPPLRERAEDIPLLAEHFLRQEGVRGVAWSPAALTAIVQYPWPGNVRELRHEAARIVARLGGASVINVPQLSSAVASAQADDGGAIGALDASATLDASLGRVERALIEAALQRHGGNVSRTAAQLGVSRARLRRRAAELGIARDIGT